MTRRLRIAVATTGRFHVLDLARELHALGHHVQFYSSLPRGRVANFGLPTARHTSLLPLTAAPLAWGRFAPQLAPKLQERALYAAVNHAVIWRLQPCDVFICMSGIYLEAMRHARRRFGARIWLERGSRHILSQDRILSAIPGAARPSPLTIRRELAGYALADRIVAPSSHVAESFSDDPAAHAKLFQNPYGTDLAMFPLSAAHPPSDPFTFVFAGGWSLRKGCDVLTSAIKATPGVRLIHLGPIIDLPFPAGDPRFTHIDTAPQNELARHYASADAFVLASREDGFGVVLSQALATGLPIICTDRTGGADLAHSPALAEHITIVPHGDAGALASAMHGLKEQLSAGRAPAALTESDRASLSWAAYAQRYSDELLADVA